jgi:hypothetical protein
MAANDNSQRRIDNLRKELQKLQQITEQDEKRLLTRREEKPINDLKVILRNVSIFDDDEVFDVLRFVTKGIRWKYTIALQVIVKDSGNNEE